MKGWKILPNRYLIYLSIIFFIYLTIQVFIQNSHGWYVNFSKASEYATLLGGIFSFISVVLIYQTLVQQADAFNKSQFENRFFELIKLHRENIANIEMRDPYVCGNESFHGHKAIRQIHKQVLSVIEVIKINFQGLSLDDIYLNAVQKTHDTENVVIKERGVNLIDLNKINIAYLCVFYGLSKEGRHTLNNLLGNKYKISFYEPILNKLAERKATWDLRETDYVKYYGGHQYRLGHLFRHLFHIVTYINDTELFDFDQKYEYVKILRAQLSTYEQTLIFFNSLTHLGSAWEYQIQIPKKISKTLNTNELTDYFVQHMLITKYNLIRNIPNEFVNTTQVSHFYPDLIFDGEENTESKNKLIEIYSRY